MNSHPRHAEVEATLASAIVGYLEARDGVTFIDLELDIPGFGGELPLKSDARPGTVLWRGLSSAAVHALRMLEVQGRIRYRDTAFRTYLDKGKRIRFSNARWGTETTWTPVLVEAARPARALH